MSRVLRVRVGRITWQFGRRHVKLCFYFQFCFKNNIIFSDKKQLVKENYFKVKGERKEEDS